MRPITLILVLLCSVTMAASSRDRIRLDVTRDTWVSSSGKEQHGNNGGSPRMKTKGSQEFALLDLDPASLRGRVITGATLHFNCASKDPQRRLTISTLTSDWTEGTAANYEPQKGSASFLWAKNDQTLWAFPGSDITAVCNGLGNTLWRFADATPPDKDGWQTVAVDPDVVAARAAGLSFGFVLFDDVGSEYERDGDRFTYHLFPNRFIYSREQNKARAPYFTIDLGPEDHAAPDPIPSISADCKELPPGECRVTWITPKDHGPAGTLGFIASYTVASDPQRTTSQPLPQYLVPLAAVPGNPVNMHLHDLGLPPGSTLVLSIRPVDRAGNAGTATTASITLSPAVPPLVLKETNNSLQPITPNTPPVTLPGVTISILDALDKVHPITGQLIPAHPATYMQSNHLWSAATKTIALHAARNEFVDFQILLSGQTDSLSAELTFDDPSIRATLHRFRHVNTQIGPLPDPLVPLTGPLSVPAKEETLPNQKHATLLADVYVPYTATPGSHTGTLLLKSAGQSVSLRVDLRIWNFTLPDHLSFIPEMNCYGLPRETELAYYRLAHQHRTCLNRLGYSWRGTISDDCAPRWTGSDFDWAEYDRRFGPLFDGSAFADLPRKSVPVESFYLPLNENWPLDVNKAFKGGYWIEDAFDPAYRAAFVNACAKFAQHLSQQKWHDTFFEFYLNNKVYFKDKSWSRCSAPWIFDEPMNTQDFWALRWYGQAFHEGATPHQGQAKLAFRCDISRPQWQRDILDGVLDVNIVGGDFRRYQRAVLDRKTRNGELTINYGSSNNIEDSNIQPLAWCLDTWCLGGDGVLPWQTIGTDQSWTQADQLSLFYPGKPAGLRDPVPSIRLKAFRRGQQDVEYLTILAAATQQPRFAIAQSVRQWLNLSATVEQKSDDDAGLVRYDRLDPAAFHALRLRIGETLDALHPSAQRRYIDFRTPIRDVGKLPRIGKAG
ncbi:MAG: hypothetical protein ACM359_14960 [Bacillota bacterium]